MVLDIFDQTVLFSVRVSSKCDHFCRQKTRPDDHQDRCPTIDESDIFDLNFSLQQSIFANFGFFVQRICEFKCHKSKSRCRPSNVVRRNSRTTSAISVHDAMRRLFKILRIARNLYRKMYRIDEFEVEFFAAKHLLISAGNEQRS